MVPVTICNLRAGPQSRNPTIYYKWVHSDYSYFRGIRPSMGQFPPSDSSIKEWSMNQLFICAGLALSISACGGSDKSRLPTQTSSSSLVSSSTSSAQSSSTGLVKPADLSPAAMSVVSVEELEGWLKNGLRLSATRGFVGNWIGGIEFAAPPG